MATPLEIFRLMAVEFVGIEDEEVMMWMELTKPFISSRRFGVFYEQALALLTAHRMKLAGVGIDATEEGMINLDGLSMAQQMRVNSISEGGISLSFNNSGAQVSTLEAELALTQYGIQFLSILRSRIIPLVSAADKPGQDN